MGIFGKNKTVAPAPAPPAPAAPATEAPKVDLGKKTGRISLEKGQRVSIEKTQEILATVSWKSGTDYDVYALVLFKDGHVETVSTFGTKDDPEGFTLSVANGAVRHQGDITRPTGSFAVEVLEIRLTPEIAAVVPVAYSAQSNGSGSFHRYKVSLAIDNGAGTRVEIEAKNANRDDGIYTCVPGIIRNTPDGVVIDALELYSRRGSEHRPGLRADGVVVMDAGPVNVYK